MGISDLRDALNDPNSSLTMRYEQGGKVQVFMMGDVEVRLTSTSAPEEIKAALADEMAKVKKAKADALILPNPFVAPDV